MTRPLTAHIWTPEAWAAKNGSKPNPDNCRASCSDNGRIIHFWQCTRKPKVFRELDHPKGTFGFCGQHDPVAVARRQAARDKKWSVKLEAQQASWQRDIDIEDAKERCVAALRDIEAGHNDPRALARETLAQLDALADDAAGEEER
jgi:glycine/D-amino acid oxidase-like deaminating enzyme